MSLNSSGQGGGSEDAGTIREQSPQIDTFSVLGILLSKCQTYTYVRLIFVRLIRLIFESPFTLDTKSQS